jgi:hypothetical protein
VVLDGSQLQSGWSVGSRVMDFPGHQIMFMFAPSVALLRASQRAGLQGSWRRAIPGLKDALERSGMKVSRD